MHAVGVAADIVESHLIVSTTGLGLKKHSLSVFAARTGMLVRAGEGGVLQISI